MPKCERSKVQQPLEMSGVVDSLLLATVMGWTLYSLVPKPLLLISVPLVTAFVQNLAKVLHRRLPAV